MIAPGTKWSRLLVGFVLGLVTVTIIHALGQHTHNPHWATVLELLQFPGVLVASVVSPGGVHGSSPWLWVSALFWGNVLFFTCLWVIAFLLMSKRQRSEGRQGSHL